MGDDSKRKILARRAQFLAASVALTLSGTAYAADASVDDAATDAEADADADTAPPVPCLSIAREPEPQACLCSIAPPESTSEWTPALLAAAGLVALRRRSRKVT